MADAAAAGPDPRRNSRGFFRTVTASSAEGIRRASRRLSWAPGGPTSYDDEYESFARQPSTPVEPPSANGVRVWYGSYTSIDWVHDDIKEHSRLRRLRGNKGLRGFAINAWDRLQGWIIVLLAGIITACIAGAIVESEAVLFDLKDGYCSKDWKLAKRFCCPYGGDQDWDRDSLVVRSSRLSGMMAGWAAPVAGSPRWETLKAGTESESCPGWVQWSEVLSPEGKDFWWADYAVYIMVAILWASLASIMTIYLTSSELFLSRKDAQQQQHTKGGQSGGHNGEATERSPLLGSSNGGASRSANGKRYTTSAVTQNASQARAQAANPPRKVLYFGSGSGISEIKVVLSGFVIRGYLGYRTLFTKSVGLALSVASGLSLGKEGPFVHIASCVGNIVCRLFGKYEHNESKRREILSCACAAGVAVAFGAPVGGVLFSLEEVSYYFSAKVMFRSFFCAMVAAAGLRFIDPFGTGKIVLFQVSYDKEWAFHELPFFVIIGAFGGLYGALFTRLNLIWSKEVRAKTWMARHPLWEVVAVTSVTVAISFLNGYTRMGGPELITDLFSECHEHESLDGLCIREPSQIGALISSVAWTMIAKGLLTIVTFGIKLPAGIFIPSLAVGACFGRIIGLLVQYVQWTRPELHFFSWCDSSSDGACIVPGIYAMVGAAATLSGVTRTTISLAVIMFELTGTLTYSIPVMISILVAKTLADALEPKGIYDLVIELSGLPYLDAKTTYTWRGYSVRDVMETNVDRIALDEDNTIAKLRRKVDEGQADGGFPIVVQEGNAARMVGYIATAELEFGLNELVEKHDSNEETTACTFSHLPQVRQANADNDGSEDDEESVVRDSTFLQGLDPQDLSRFVDKAPITVNISSPLELCHSLFVRLGVRYLVVVDARGLLRGVITKKRWLAFVEHGDSAEDGDGH